MPLSELVERNGGQMLRSFAQGQYMTKMEFHPSQSEGVCSALSTQWIVKRANGQDFFKYVDTKDGRNEIAMLQGREHGLKASSEALARSALLLDQDILKVKAYQGPDRGAKIDDLAQKKDGLLKTAAFLEQEKKEQHLYRSQYVESKTGLTGEIDKTPGSAAAIHDVTGHEGYVIFGMTGEKGGHAVAMYHSPRHGIRFFDPNFGEAYFESHTSFEAFLGEFTKECSKLGLGTMKSTELTTFDFPMMPKSPEDAELTTHSYLPLNMAFPEMAEEQSTAEERTPLLSDVDDKSA